MSISKFVSGWSNILPGQVTVYATSLLDESQYSRKAIINLYKQPWGVEEAYKTLKARLDVVHFSGKTVLAVQQDFYAKVFLITLTSILKSGIKPKLNTKKKSQNKDQRVPIVNNTFAISQVKKLLHVIYHQVDEALDWILQFIRSVRDAIEYSRKGQSNKRTEDKGHNRVFSQNYKTI